ALSELPQKGIDTGMGLERLAMVVKGKRHIFETDLFLPFIELLPHDLEERRTRIIADHLRASAFLIADGIRPSNKEKGYILRRLMRRVMAYESTEHLEPHLLNTVVHEAIHMYGDFYPELKTQGAVITDTIQMEREKFGKTLHRGLQEMAKDINQMDEKRAFYLYETFGLPFEVIREFGGLRGKELDHKKFEAEMIKHQEISRAGVEKKFGGHGLLLDTDEIKAADEGELKKVTRLHTATHLLQAALRRVLGLEVRQMGSDITAARTRFDFSFPRKLTPEELRLVEDMVNGAVRDALPVRYEEMGIEEAKKTGALYFFKEKYPLRVKVYQVGEGNKVFSREFCGGPHVVNTREIGKFVILKEEAVAGGVRRIRAAVEP
ncbi:MAG: alanine--tRNA ligase-related protein, partial [Patescibacteria group bacterium]